MSHFAKIENNIVTNVIVAEQGFIDTLADVWIQTSYNTYGGIHYGQDGLPDGGVALRKNYAGIGYIYDSVLDAFYTPVPNELYQLDQNTCLWVIKPEYTPLVVAKVITQATSVPVGIPNQELVIDGISVFNLDFVLFTATTIPAEQGVYQYNQPLGTLTFVDMSLSTIVGIDDTSVVYKYVNNVWVSMPT